MEMVRSVAVVSDVLCTCLPIFWCVVLDNSTQKSLGVVKPQYVDLGSLQLPFKFCTLYDHTHKSWQCRIAGKSSKMHQNEIFTIYDFSDKGSTTNTRSATITRAPSRQFLAPMRIGNGFCIVMWQNILGYLCLMFARDLGM